MLQVRELERRSEKLQNEVKNAAAAKEELTRLRKDVRDVSSQKGELENLVRELQKEEFALRVCACTPKPCLLPLHIDIVSLQLYEQQHDAH